MHSPIKLIFLRFLSWKFSADVELQHFLNNKNELKRDCSSWQNNFYHFCRLRQEGRSTWEKHLGPKKKQTTSRNKKFQWKCTKEKKKTKFQKHKQINLGEPNFKQLLQLRNSIERATGDFSGEEQLQPLVISLCPKIWKNYLKHVQKAITIVDGPIKKIIATMKRYCVDKRDTS